MRWKLRAKGIGKFRNEERRLTMNVHTNYAQLYEPLTMVSQNPKHHIPNPFISLHLGINTLRIRINLQPRLRHLRLTQEIQRHPNQMPFNLIQLLPHHIHRLEHIEQMPGLPTPLSAQKLVVVLKRLDIIVRIRMEQMPEHLGISRGLTRPHLPKLIAHRVRDEFVVLVAVHPVVIAVAGRLGIDVVSGVEGLGGEETEVLAPEHAAESGGVVACGVGLAVHEGLQGQGVFHDDGELGVVEAELGAVVDVAAAADDDAVVYDEELRGIVSGRVFLHGCEGKAVPCRGYRALPGRSSLSPSPAPPPPSYHHPHLAFRDPCLAKALR